MSPLATIRTLREADRILVLGSSGAGKSTLAGKLARALDLPLIHLDAEYWQPGWVPTAEAAWRARVSELVRGDRWVMDGNFSDTFDLRIPRADLLVVLDLPRRVCLFRVLWRVITTYGTVRPDTAPGCPERFDFEFLKWVWSFPKRVRPTMVAAAESAPAIVLGSTTEVAAFVESLGLVGTE